MGRWTSGRGALQAVLNGSRDHGGAEVLPRPPAVVGAHGGSGTTTVAQLLEAEDAGVVIPADVDRRPVVVTALATAHGARLAVERAAELRRLGAPAVVVAVAGDGPWPAPVAVRARLRALEPEVDAVVRLPYVVRWRFVDRPDAPPRRYLEAISAIRTTLTAHYSPAGARR